MVQTYTIFSDKKRQQRKKFPFAVVLFNSHRDFSQLQSGFFMTRIGVLPNYNRDFSWQGSGDGRMAEPCVVFLSL